MSADFDPVDVLELLEDEYAREILVTASVEPMSARTLGDECDASLPTIYRRVDALDPTIGTTAVTGGARLAVVPGAFVVTAVLGVLIAYRAYQGYRRNRSTPMLFLAVGLVLVTAVAPLLSLVLSNATELAGLVVVLAMTASQTCGLVSILYSLYGDFGPTPGGRTGGDRAR